MARPRASTIDVATRTRLLAAAERAFGESGFHGARLEDIAAAAGITRPSLLYHFGSKDRLHAEVVRSAFARLGRALAAAMRAGSPFGRRLDALVVGFLSFLEEHSSLPALVLREVLDRRGPGRRHLVSAVGPILAAVERFVEAGRTGGRGAAPRAPVRAALMALVTSALVRAAAPRELRDALWGQTDRTRELAGDLFLRAGHGEGGRSA
jgi:TetR/AcrR family transcriptional regulator